MVSTTDSVPQDITSNSETSMKIDEASPPCENDSTDNRNQECLPVKQEQHQDIQHTNETASTAPDAIQCASTNAVAGQIKHESCANNNESTAAIPADAIQSTAVSENQQVVKEEYGGDDEEEEEEEEEEEMDSSDWKESMKAILDSTYSHGQVSTSHEIQMPALFPKMVVEGMSDRISFPLTRNQAKSLIESSAEKAPFGKGHDTVLDEKVRKAWQVDASKVTFLDLPIWKAKLKEITQRCVQDLGLNDYQKPRVQANLYKLLLYEQGGHFSKHRDTEKEPGMFATMVLQLPSRHTGGELVVHGSKTYNYSAKSEDGFFATAFFADCEHELLPVTSGYRMCLVYNLVLSHTTDLPSATTTVSTNQELQRMVRQMPAFMDPVQGYLLHHKYTKTNLHFRNLKGRDLETVTLLRNAVDENGDKLYHVCLLLMEKHQVGTPECPYGYGRRYSRRYDDYEDHDNGPFRMEEVHDEDESADHWIGPDDTQLHYFNLGFDKYESLLVDDAEDGVFEEDPDNEEFEGFTGNAGPTLEYWYWKSVVVFWPRSRLIEIAARTGQSLKNLRKVFGAVSARKRSAAGVGIGSKKRRQSAPVIQIDDPPQPVAPENEATKQFAGNQDDPIVL